MGHMRRHSAASSQHSSHQEVMNEMVDMGELEETERQAARPFWMRVRFYQILIPLLVSAILILVGVLLAAYQPVSVSFLTVLLKPGGHSGQNANGSSACSCTVCSCCCPGTGSIVAPTRQQGRSTTSYMCTTLWRAMAAHKLHV